MVQNLQPKLIIFKLKETKNITKKHKKNTKKTQKIKIYK